MPRAIFDKAKTALLDLLAPARCHGCGAEGRAPLCAGCAAALPWNDLACRACALPLAPAESAGAGPCGACRDATPPQDATWAAFAYRAPVAQQIVGLKFHGRLAPAHVLGTLMAARLAMRPQPLPELLVPVPLHASRLRQRGYNQALELARHIGPRLSIRLAPQAARRVRATGEQTRLDAAGRQRNVRGAFEVGGLVRGRHLALLDDVITTGATVAELARAARAAGARRIEVWAVARVA